MLGEGAWGSAIATVLAHNGITVHLWCHDESMPADIINMRCNNRYLPSIELSPYIQPSSSMSEVVAQAQDIFIAIPVQHLRSVLELLAKDVTRAHRYILLCKGIEQETGFFPTQMVHDTMGKDVTVAVVAGPSFAYDVARKQLTGVVVASQNQEYAQHVQHLLSNDYFKTEYSADVIGVQVGASLKNVVALMAGMLDGAGCAASTQALVVTKMFQEMVFLSEVSGATSSTTLYGLSGFGDTMLTVYGGLSKNRFVGKQVGMGRSLESVLKETGYIPEGVNTVQALRQHYLKYQRNIPLLLATGDSIQQTISVADVLRGIVI